MKEQLNRIEAKLDRVIKAMQEYDGVDEDFKEPEQEYSWKSITTMPSAVKSKVVAASKRFGEEEAEEIRELLRGSKLDNLPGLQHTPPPPPPKPKKKKYYKPRDKK